MTDRPLDIHMTAICGMGMAPLAVLLSQAGHRVRGSDKAAFPPMSDALAAAGLEITIGFAAENLDPEPDLVIIGNAVSRDNVEAAEVERRGLERISFPEAVSRFFLDGRRSLVVAGTHGKTTTTGMLARALQTAGFDPGYLVGGRVRDLGALAYAGEPPYFAIEGDEYDTAYFDKGPKFLHYRPAAAIVTSLEFDHADIYDDVEQIEGSFRRLVELLPEDGPLVACAEYERVRTLAAGHAAAVTYATGGDADWTLGDIDVSAAGTRAPLVYRGRHEADLELGLLGSMNALNALAVYALGRELGVDGAGMLDGLRGYRGAARRQEILGEARGVVVIDDFAHHPTAVAATVSAVRAAFADRRLVAVFEPRSNTSRRAIFQSQYTDALFGADVVALSEVFRKANDPLTDDEALSPARITEELGHRGVDAFVGAGPDELVDRLTTTLRPNDVALCMSNGDFGNLPRRLLANLEKN